jgi:hypothetical protein
MKLTALYLILFIAFANQVCEAQITVPERRKFNLGLSISAYGQSGSQLNPIPSLNLKYRGTNLSLNKGLHDFTIGLSQEIKPLSIAFSNVFFIGSGNFSTGQTEVGEPELVDFQSYSLLGGVRYYMGKRFYGNLQFGGIYIDYQNVKDSIILPHIEFALGFNFWPNFLPKK